MDCTFDGNSDMYGLGIRVGFYLQWFGAIFASFLAPNEVEGARFALATFNAATFLALVIQTAQNSLRPVEVYLIVLLTFGFYHSMIPLYAWRLLTWWDPSKDPSRYPIVPASPTYSDLHIPLLLAVVSFQMWFWIAKVPMLGSQPCGEYGFLFAKIRLNQPAFRIINIILYVILGTIILCIAVTRVTSRKSVTDYAEDEKRLEDRMGRDKLIKRISSLQRLDSATKFVTASIVVVATEMTIDWNGISDVNSLSSAGQTIPFLLGFALVVRLLYLYYIKPFLPKEKDIDSENLVDGIEPLPGPQHGGIISPANGPISTAHGRIPDTEPRLVHAQMAHQMLTSSFSSEY